MGRILMIEFEDRDTAVFDEIMRALEKHPSFEQFRVRDESTLSLPELDIFLRRRKAYSGYREIPLTAKEFDILCMLAANKGIVLTYITDRNKESANRKSFYCVDKYRNSSRESDFFYSTEITIFFYNLIPQIVIKPKSAVPISM